LGFLDESAQRISVRTARVWSLGKPVRRVNSERINANVFGFYAIDGVSASMFPGSSKASDMCAFLDAVRAANGERKVVIVLDNGRIHHSRTVVEHAARLKITLVFLPPYSPQFNPIEFIWKTIKSRISGMFLLHREHLVDAVRTLFEQESAKQSYAEGWKRTFLMAHDSNKLSS